MRHNNSWKHKSNSPIMSSGRARGNFWRGRGQRFRGGKSVRGTSQTGRGEIDGNWWKFLCSTLVTWRKNLLVISWNYRFSTKGFRPRKFKSSSGTSKSTANTDKLNAVSLQEMELILPRHWWVGSFVGLVCNQVHFSSQNTYPLPFHSQKWSTHNFSLRY